MSGLLESSPPDKGEYREAGRGLTPRLRFPEFREAGEWEEKTLGQIIVTVPPPKKLVTANYLTEGSFPIVDQSQNNICGWTNDSDSLICGDFPLIIFGDHTCALKMMSKPFAQGADGIKIFRAKLFIDTEYLYHLLSFRPVVTEEYRRHFSILKGKKIFFPDKKSGEQQKIASCLTSLDELITLEAKKLGALKSHKKGLMQQLFPADETTPPLRGTPPLKGGEFAGKQNSPPDKGEYREAGRGLTPRLRFPEFLDAGEWKNKPLAKVCNVLQGYGFPEALQGKSEGKYPFCKVSDISRAVAENGGLLSEAMNYIGDDELLQLRAKTIQKGATVFAKIGEALRLNRRAYVQKECLVDNNVTGLKAICGIADDYFVYLMSQLIDLNKHCGGAVPSVNKSTLEKIEVVVPSPVEQQRIADCLSSLDNLITAQTKKIAALKTHKQGLMQLLFPSIEETGA